MRALIDVGKVSTASSLHTYTKSLFSWAAKWKPWRLLLDVNPVEEVDIKRMIPAEYQDWCNRVLDESEIIELRRRFVTIRNQFEFAQERDAG